MSLKPTPTTIGMPTASVSSRRFGFDRMLSISPIIQSDQVCNDWARSCNSFEAGLQAINILPSTQPWLSYRVVSTDALHTALAGITEHATNRKIQEREKLQKNLQNG